MCLFLLKACKLKYDEDGNRLSTYARVYGEEEAEQVGDMVGQGPQ